MLDIGLSGFRCWPIYNNIHVNRVEKPQGASAVSITTYSKSHCGVFDHQWHCRAMFLFQEQGPCFVGVDRFIVSTYTGCAVKAAQQQWVRPPSVSKQDVIGAVQSEGHTCSHSEPSPKKKTDFRGGF